MNSWHAEPPNEVQIPGVVRGAGEGEPRELELKYAPKVLSNPAIMQALERLRTREERLREILQRETLRTNRERQSARLDDALDEVCRQREAAQVPWFGVREAEVSEAKQFEAEWREARLRGRYAHPHAAEYLIYFFLPRDDRESLPGDLSEQYYGVILPKFGSLGARLWYWKEVVSSIGPILGRWCQKKAKRAILILAAVSGWNFAKGKPVHDAILWLSSLLRHWRS